MQRRTVPRQGRGPRDAWPGLEDEHFDASHRQACGDQGAADAGADDDDICRALHQSWGDRCGAAQVPDQPDARAGGRHAQGAPLKGARVRHQLSFATHLLYAGVPCDDDVALEIGVGPRKPGGGHAGCGEQVLQKTPAAWRSRFECPVRRDDSARNSSSANDCARGSARTNGASMAIAEMNARRRSSTM